MKRRFLIILLVVVGLYAVAGFLVLPRLLHDGAVDYVEGTLDRKLDIERVEFNPFIFQLKVKGLRLAEKDGQPLLGAQRLLVDFSTASMFRRAWTFETIGLQEPRVNLVLAEDGSSNFTRLLDDMAGDEPEPPESPDDDAQPRFLVRKLDVSGGAVTVTELGGAGDKHTEISPLGLRVDDLSTIPDRDGEHAITAQLPGGGVLKWKGSLSLTPMQSVGRVSLDGFSPAAIWPFLQDQLNLEPPGGKIGLQTRYRFEMQDETPQVTLNGLRMEIFRPVLTVSGDPAPLLELERISISGGSFDLASQNLVLGEVRISDGGIKAYYDGEGRGNWERVVAGTAGGEGDPPVAGGDDEQTQAGQGGEAGAPWLMEVGALMVDDVALALDDGRVSPASRYRIGAAALSLTSRIELSPGGMAGMVKDLAVRLQGVSLGREGGARPLLAIDDAGVLGGSIDLGQMAMDIRKANVTGGNLRAAVDAAGNLDWEALFPAQTGQTDAGGAVQPWSAEVQKVFVDDISVAYADASRANPITLAVDDLDLTVKVSVTQPAAGEQTTLVQDLQVTGAGIWAHEKDEPMPFLAVSRARLRNGEIDVAAQSVNIGELRADGGAVDVWLDADGQLNWMRLTSPSDQGRMVKEEAQAHAGGQTWSVEVAQAGVYGFGAEISDRSLETPHVVSLTDIRAQASSISTAADAQFPFDLAFGVREGGQVSAQGSVFPGKPAAEVNVLIRDLALSPAEPYLNEALNMEMTSGAASLETKLRYGLDGEDAVRGSGQLTVNSLLLRDRDSKETLLGWRSMATRGMRYSMAPDELLIDEVRFRKPAGKLVIHEDLTTNWRALVEDEDASGDDPGGKGGDAEREPITLPLKVKVARVRLDGGELDFTDQSLPLNFRALIHDLKGTVSGLDSNPEARAGMALDGAVNEYGTVRIEGELQPFANTEYSDVTMTFRNLDMPKMTPYTVKFAGYEVASGKLSLDLQYRVLQGKLDSKNRIVMEQFTLGEKVESPDAVDLPLHLAIALLKDGNGVIDIALPVSGDVSDPEFSYGHVIVKALFGLIAKAATAPFKLLGAMLGVEGDDLGQVAFEPGSADLPPPEKEKLKSVVTALQQRPQLALDVEATYDTTVDGQAMRSLAARTELARLTGVTLKPGEDPGPVSFHDKKTQKAIKKLYIKRFSRDDYRKLEATVKAGTGNAQGTAEAKGEAPAPEEKLYRDMFAQVVKKEPLGKDALPKLAQARAVKVLEELTVVNGIDKGRLGTAPVKAVDNAGPDRVSSQLILKPLK